MGANDLSKEDLLRAAPGSLDTESLQFEGTRGNQRQHLDREELEAGIAALPAAPLDRGVVSLLVARPSLGERDLPTEALLTPDGGMPGDRWASDDRYGPQYQLATAQTDMARLIANGQPLELHGDNLFITLDLSDTNLPIGSTLSMGEARLCVTPKAHNGCKKWVQRFGLDAMQLNMDASYLPRHLRGIYLRVLEAGLVRVGDVVEVIKRGV